MLSHSPQTFLFLVFYTPIHSPHSSQGFKKYANHSLTVSYLKHNTSSFSWPTRASGHLSPASVSNLTSYHTPTIHRAFAMLATFLPFLKLNKLVPTIGLCTRCSPCPQPLSPDTHMCGSLLCLQVSAQKSLSQTGLH